MAYEAIHTIEPQSVIFSEGFQSAFDVRRNGGSPTNVSFVNGKAVNTTGYIDYPSLTLPSAWSIRVKFKSTDLSNVRTLFGNLNTVNHYTRYYVWSDGALRLYTETNQVAMTSAGDIVVNTDYEIVITNDGTGANNIQYYKNGEVLEAAKTLTGDFVFRQLLADGNNGYPLVGNCDLFKIYNYALTASEISNLYENKRFRELPSGCDEQLGAELITDGSFNTACGVNWTCGAGWAISGGKAVATATTATIQEAGVITIGKRYRIAFTVSDYSAGTTRFITGSTFGTNRSANGTYTEIAICTGSTTLAIDGGVAFTGKIDNVSCKEVLVEETQEILNISIKGSIPSEDKWGNALVNTAIEPFKIGSNVYAVKLDGTTSLINIDSIVSSLSAETTGTFMAWINTTDANATQEIISFGDTDADTRIQFDLMGSGLLRALVGEGGVTKWALDTDAVAVKDNTWVHVALVQDGTDPVLYVNAEAVAQTFSTSTDKTYWFSDMAGLDNGRIGCGSWNGGGNATFFGGLIDGVRIDKGILTAQKISQAYTESKHLYNL